MKRIKSLVAPLHSPRRSRNTALALAAVSAMAGIGGFARYAVATPVTLYWDTSTAAGLQAGAGTWDVGTTANWNTNTTSAGTTTWTNGDVAVFDGTNTVTVADGAAVDAYGIVASGNGNVPTIEGGTNDTGTLQIDAGGITITNNSSSNYIQSNVILGANQTWNIGNSGGGGLIVSGPVSEANTLTTLTIAGPRSVYFENANTYSGGTILSGGGIVAENNAALGTGQLTVTGTSSLQSLVTYTTLPGTTLTTSSVTLNNNIVVNSGVTLNLLGGSDPAPLILNGNVSSSSSSPATITTGAGTSEFGGNNSGFYGTINVFQGTYLNNNAAGSANAIWNGTNGSGSLRLNSGASGTIYLGGISGSLPIQGETNSSSVIYTLDVGGAGQTEIESSAITQPFANKIAFVMVGSGTQTLAGADTYSNGTTVESGTLIAGNNSAFGTGGVTLGDATTASGNLSPTLLNAGYSVSNPIVVSTNATTGVYTIGGSNTTGTATYAGNITLNQPVVLVAAAGGTTDFSTGTWTVNNNAPITVAATTGGTVELDKPITDSGGIAVTSGTLKLTNSFTGPADVYTGELAGTGTVTGQTTTHGGSIISPGGDGTVGTINLAGGLNFGTNDTFNFDLGSLTTVGGSANDLILTSNLTFTDASTDTVAFNFLGTPVMGQPYTLIGYSGMLTGVPTLLTATGLPAGYAAIFTDTGLSNGDVQVTFVPEPASLSLLALGSLGLLARRKRRRA